MQVLQASHHRPQARVPPNMAPYSIMPCEHLFEVNLIRSTGLCMAEIAILPLAECSSFSGLFEQRHSAEGSWGWYRSLAETTLSPGEEAVVAVAFNGRTATAALPLARRGPGLRALTAPYTTLYAPPLHDVRWARFLGADAQSFVEGSLQLDAFDPADLGMAAFLDGLQFSGLIAAQYQSFANFYERIGNFEEYWNARPSRLRATVRRKLAQSISEQADFRCYRDAFGEAVAIYEEVYRASWKAVEPHPTFIANMVEKLACFGFIRIGVMRLRGKPVAVQVWLVCGRKGTIFKLAHREDAQHCSPGTLLTHWMISSLVRDEGLDEIDFGRGADLYKRDWMTKSRFRRGVIAGNWKSYAGLRLIVGELIPMRLSAAVRRTWRR